MVLRVKPTPTLFPTNSLYTPMENTPLHSISSVFHPWGMWWRPRCYTDQLEEAIGFLRRNNYEDKHFKNGDGFVKALGEKAHKKEIVIIFLTKSFLAGTILEKYGT